MMRGITLTNIDVMVRLYEINEKKASALHLRVHFRIGATFLKLHCRARSVRRVARNFSALSANSAVKSNVYLAFAPELKCTLIYRFFDT